MPVPDKIVESLAISLGTILWIELKVHVRVCVGVGDRPTDRPLRNGYQKAVSLSFGVSYTLKASKFEAVIVA